MKKITLIIGAIALLIAFTLSTNINTDSNKTKSQEVFAGEKRPMAQSTDGGFCCKSTQDSSCGAAACSTTTEPTDPTGGFE